MIVNTLDNSTEALCRHLTWMNSHTTANNFRQKVKSDGRNVTAVDWRANGLADALAKIGSSYGQAHKTTTNLIDSATELIKQQMGVLGAITHAANHCKRWVRDEDGTWNKTRCRDAQQTTGKSAAQLPRKCKRKKMDKVNVDDLPELVAPPAKADECTQRRRKFAPRKRKKNQSLAAAHVAYQACVANHGKNIYWRSSG